MDTSSFLIALLLVGIVALLFFSLHSIKKGRQSIKEENTVSTERNSTATVPMQKSMTRVQRLRSKSGQIGLLQWLLDVLLIINSVCVIWLISELSPDNTFGFFIVGIIICTVIAIYCVDVWASAKREMCEAQADILEKLYKMGN